jgi:hypothetical protein
VQVNLVHRNYVVFPGAQPEVTIGGENVRLRIAKLMSKVSVPVLKRFMYTYETMPLGNVKEKEVRGKSQ